MIFCLLQPFKSLSSILSAARAFLIDAIGRPYRWDLLAIRIVIAVIVIIRVVWKLAPQLVSDRVSDYDFLRGLVLSIVGIYGLIEFFIGYRYFRRLERLRQTA